MGKDQIWEDENLLENDGYINHHCFNAGLNPRDQATPKWASRWWGVTGPYNLYNHGFNPLAK